MKTKDLISLLQEADSSGNSKVVIFDEFNGVLFGTVKSVTPSKLERSVLVNVRDIDERLRATNEEEIRRHAFKR